MNLHKQRMKKYKVTLFPKRTILNQLLKGTVNGTVLLMPKAIIGNIIRRKKKIKADFKQINL